MNDKKKANVPFVKNKLPQSSGNILGGNSLRNGIFGLLFGGLISALILWIKKIAPMEQKLEKIEIEKEQFAAQLEQQSNIVQTQAIHQKISWVKHWRKILLAVVAILLSLVGPVFVILNRWFDVSFVLSLSRDVWCKSSFLCETILPSYFLYVSLAIFTLIVLLLFVGPKVTLPFKASFSFKQVKSQISDRQRVIATVIGSISLISFAVDIGLSFFANRKPGPEFALFILFYAVFCYFREFSWQEIRQHIKSIPTWIFPLILFLLGLLSFMRALYEPDASVLLPLILIFVSVVLLIPQYRKIPKIIWLSIGCLIFFTFLIDSWRYSIIGDEFSFFNYSRIALSESNVLILTLKNFLNPKTLVHGKFVFLSLFPNILTMEMFGSANFGWRIINPLLCCASLPFFYLFIKRFMNHRMAILFSILMTSSHFLIGFSKIGYNNLTALFSMSILLWLTGKALDVNRNFGYTLLGLCLGLSLYSYPAILAVLPAPILLLFLYNPPYKSRTSAYQWFMLIIAFFLLLFPILVEPDYWADKIRESSIASTIVWDHQFHFYSNLLYTFFSPFYAPENSHFVTISFLDAISGALLVFGFVSILKQLKKDKFAWFTLITYLFLFISLGSSRDRNLPSATHFFVYLPIWWMIVVYGIDYISRLLFFDENSAWRIDRFQKVLMISIVLLNLFQAYWLSPQNSKQYYNNESLFLRFLQQVKRENVESTLNFLYITDADWNIYGIRDLQNAYRLPPDEDQLMRSPMFVGDIEPEFENDANWVPLPMPENIVGEIKPQPVKLEAWALEQIKNPDTVIIINPLPADEYRIVLENTLIDNDRQPCELSSGPNEDARVYLWLHESRMGLCPVNGIWPHFW